MFRGAIACTNSTSRSYPNDDGADDDGNMFEDQEDPIDGEVSGQDDQAEGEEVRRNDEAASRTTRRVITVVNKEVTDH